MMRLHLVEIHDLRFCPPSLRDALTDFLAFALRLGQSYAPAAPLLARAVARSGARRIVDLCAGAGGPWGELAPVLGLPVLLTDLYPHAHALESRFVRTHATPVDARAVPRELTGFRTLFTSFHHFPPDQARGILADAVAARQGIAVFDVVRRAPFDIAFVALTWLGMLVAGPFVRPRRWSRLLWTYLPPVLPVIGTVDGVVSCLRAYTPAELEHMVRDFEGYAWQIGVTRARRSPLHMTYLIGVPA